MAVSVQTAERRIEKSAQAFRTISEVATELDVPQHVLRFWESKFSQVRPLKRGGGRRYYRPEDIDLLRRIRTLLYDDGYTIKGVQRLLREGGGKLSDNIPPATEDERAMAALERAGVPEPPPRGPRGADRITILEDTDGDGQADRGRDFVSGLNLATGLAFGHGGVGTSYCWGDPASGVSFAYITNNRILAGNGGQGSNGASGASDQIVVLYGSSPSFVANQTFTTSTATSKKTSVRSGFNKGDLVIVAGNGVGDGLLRLALHQEQAADPR